MSPPAVPVPCRLCGRDDTMQVLHAFGAMPVAGYLEASPADARSAPRHALAIALCQACRLVQQAGDTAQAGLVDRVYADYQPTYTMSRRVTRYLGSLLDGAVRDAGAGPGDRALEIGSNDGHLLRLLEDRGMVAVGVEPALALASAARERGADVLTAYFGTETARAYAASHPPARLVISRHTLEHAFDPVDFLRGIAQVLAPDGLAVIEVPYLQLQMIHGHFEAMTFQHVSFFTVRSISAALRVAGLVTVDVSFVDMDGGSMVVHACTAPAAAPAPHVETVCHLEDVAGLDRPSGYDDFFRRVTRLRASVRPYLSDLTRRGLTVAAYGAGSKGQALLNMLDLDTAQIPFVIDDTPGVAGRYVPGTGTEVVANTDPRVHRPDLILVTAPTHAQEIVARNAHRTAAGTRFLATAPDVHHVMQPDPSAIAPTSLA